MSTSTHTTSNTVKAYFVGHIRDRVNALNDRIAKKGLGQPVTLTVGPGRRHHEPDGDIYTVHDVTVQWQVPVLPGGWTLIAAADFHTADTPLVHNLVDDIDLRAGDVTNECHHCHTRRNRHDVFVVRSTDGELVQVGRTCVRDFLGHDPATLVWLAGVAAQLDDEMFGGYDAGPADVQVATLVAAARAAVITWGWTAASAEVGTPTRTAMVSVLRGVKTDDPVVQAEVRAAQQLAGSDDVKAYAAAAIEWAASLPGDSSFEENLRAIARSEYVTPKAFGFAAYLPVGYARHLDAEAHRRAQDERRANAEACPTGKVQVEGEVVGLKEQHSAYGCTLKMTVMTDAGWRVWVTVPTSIDPVRGDRVRFCCTVTPSDDDATFGFGKRPTKAEVLEPAGA